MERGEQGDTGLGDDSEQEPDDELEGRGLGWSNKIYKSQMPWFSTEQCIRKSNTNISCNKTRDIIETFQQDPATVKRWIRCATSAPAGFPSTEWDALIKGELTPSLALCTMSTALTKVSDVLELLKYSLDDQNPHRRLKQAASGPPPTTSLSKRWCSSSPINMMNCGSTATILRNYSQQSPSLSTEGCSAMMLQSDTKLGKDKAYSSPIQDNSVGTMRQLSPQMELESTE